MMKKNAMNTLSRILMTLLVAAGLVACSDSNDHGHSHDGGEAHEHEHSEGGHSHEGGEHNHDKPETEAYYGDEADMSSTAEMPVETPSDNHEHHSGDTAEGQDHHDHGEGADDHHH